MNIYFFVKIILLPSDLTYWLSSSILFSLLILISFLRFYYNSLLMSPMATLFHLALMLSIYPLFASITITHDSCKNLLMRWLNLRMTLYETVSLDGKSCPLSVRIIRRSSYCLLNLFIFKFGWNSTPLLRKKCMTREEPQ